MDEVLTQEQIKLSRHNHALAVKYFKWNGEWFEGCVLHHADKTLRHNNIERYIQWNPRDLVVMSRSEHSRLHCTGEGNARYGKEGTFKGKHHSEETCKTISEKNKGKTAWNKGLTKETDERVKKNAEATSKSIQGHTPWNKGLKGVQVAWNKGLKKGVDY